ncbi:MAG: CPBP family glutamic-type intramembrane protease [Gemmataceae bacterium]|nr:CPBP family glutamic-type intramembrane protease [Gemmataceae bacterium]
MSGTQLCYTAATRHPWACTSFVLPLLIFYEVGLYVLGQARPDEVRNGADAWLRGLLHQVGISPVFGAPVLLVAGLLSWSMWRRGDRPRDFVSVWVGMTLESGVFALGLLCLGQLVFPVVQTLDRWLTLPPSRAGALMAISNGTEAAWDRIVGYVGAGIYEETLFRLGLYPVLRFLLTLLHVRRCWALCGAALLSALAFAIAHNLGPQGEPLQVPVFVFRILAGLYFTWIYQFRGFGIAVGAHVSYDILVGLLIRDA